MVSPAIMLLITLLLRRHVNAKDCNGFFDMQNTLLQGHVIETKITTKEECRQRCTRNRGCYSINYKYKKSQCELNGASHLSHPENFTPEPGAYYAVVKPLTSCSNAFCPGDSRCLMRNDGKTYKCATEIRVKASEVYGEVLINDFKHTFSKSLQDDSPPQGHHRGHNFIAISCINNELIAKATIDTYGDSGAGAKIVSFINGLPNGVIVALSVIDDGSAKLTAAARDSISSLGALNPALAFGQTYAFVGYKGSPIPAWVKEDKNSRYGNASEVAVRVCNCEVC
ncbi:uncharacterized protein LOC116617144 [Nematostella vectensis]|uniref:uncharacterized protein LOC116617144 n=1 Tax=Nematostella vectensis TaxID=45351 RepID=UPI002076F3C7|nr:uncharacterized protein LOC116617144 [Nematostella vectensis]